MDGSGCVFFEGFRFDPCGGGLFLLGQAGIAAPVALGSRALALLGLLVRRKGGARLEKTRSWPPSGREGRSRKPNLNVQISKLGHILDQNRPQGSCIQTVTGYGHRFTAEVMRVDLRRRRRPSRL
jgi:DNA-binding winged helix-turn-helix (wHTH) protein